MAATDAAKAKAIPGTRRILVATHGSTGDLAPFVPVVAALQALGDECQFAVPRFLGLHLRRLGIPHVTYGSGTDSATLRDDRLVTNRFAGWESWRRLTVDHIGRALPVDVASIAATFDAWSPDIVVTSTFAVAPRVAARTSGIPHVALSLYPQLQVLEASNGRSFARGLLSAVGEAAAESPDDPLVRALAWGQTDGGALLHDPVLVAPSSLSAPEQLIGFPYWDAFPHHSATVDEIKQWLANRNRPVVLVTLGSFVRRPATLDAIVHALASLAVDVLIINSGRDERTEHVVATGFVPLSSVASHCAAAVHHGGIGTTYGILRSRVPSVIVPQAFDQQYNANLVARAGVGRSTTLADLTTTVRSVLRDDTMLDVTTRSAASLIPTDDVVRRACELIRSAT